MAEYRVAVSSRAERDADNIYAWIAGRSPEGASKWYSAFRKMLRSLEQDPERHARAPEAATLGLDIQQALFKTRYGHTYRALHTRRRHGVCDRGARRRRRGCDAG
jgi:plasmid stabilization system protein ParE